MTQHSPTPPPPVNYQAMQVGTEQDPQARTFGMLCHLLSLAGYTVIPLGHIIGPLIMWLVKKDTMPFVDRCGREALNFNISWTIYMIVGFALMFVLVGFVLVPVLFIGGLVLTIIAAVKANAGESYRYPLTIRFF